GDPAFLDPGSLGDPLVGGVDDLGEIIVGQDPGRQVAANPSDHRPHAIQLKALPYPRVLSICFSITFWENRSNSVTKSGCTFELELGVELCDVARQALHHPARGHVIGKVDGAG